MVGHTESDVNNLQLRLLYPARISFEYEGEIKSFTNKQKLREFRDQKKAGVAILISDKIHFKTKAVKRDKQGHYVMIKGSIQEEDIIIINVYAPNIGPLHYVRQVLTSMKGEINNNTIIVGDFNTPLTPMNRSTKQKISKKTQTLSDTMDQLDLIHIYRTFHSKKMNFTFFSSAHGTFCRIDHILGHKSSLDNLKKPQCSKIRCKLQEKRLFKIPTYGS